MGIWEKTKEAIEYWLFEGPKIEREDKDEQTQKIQPQKDYRLLFTGQ